MSFKNSRGGSSSRGTPRGGRGGRGSSSGQLRRRPAFPFALADELGIDTKRQREKERDLKHRDEIGEASSRGGRGGRLFPARGGITRASRDERSNGVDANDRDLLQGISTETLLAELQKRPTTQRQNPASTSSRTSAAPSTSTDTHATAADTETKKRKRPTSSSSLPHSLPASLLASSSSSSSKRPRTKQELDEDAEIAWLEFHLGKRGQAKASGKGKGKGKDQDFDVSGVDGISGGGDMDEDDDGLDDLLGFVDTIVPGLGGAGNNAGKDGEGVSVDSDEDDHQQRDPEDEDVDEQDQGSIGSSDEDEEDEDLSAFYSEDEENDSDESITAATRRNTARNATTAAPVPVSGQGSLVDASQARESAEAYDESIKGVRAADAYGTPISALTTAAARPKYVPPALRALQAQGLATGGQVKSDSKIKLERKVQGLLNKLGESNVDSILGELEGVYRENPRNDVTSTITDLIIGTIADKANLLETFVVLYASLVAALYKVIGVEFGAYFLQTLVTRYNTESTLHQTTTIETSSSDAAKQPLNMLTLISELYNFQVVSCKLVYDIIKGFIDAMDVDHGMHGEREEGGETGEFSVEGLLKIMRCSGPQLRSDDPAALKDIVQLVQQKTTGRESSLSPRSKFMIETLVNIKNNKSKSIPGGQMGAEATMRMKKYLAGLSKKRTILTYEPLRVSLQDILNADTKGKWWLVGAGWAGNPLVDRQADANGKAPSEKPDRKAKSTAVEVDDNDDLGSMAGQDGEALLKLAKKQGMNTDIRRSVFVILMTSDDFMHATERLGHLKLTELQEREFVRVALHCCSVEPTYNPYYALFLAHICSESYSHRFTLQYAIWDLLRDLGEKDVGGSQISEGGRGSSMAFGGNAAGGSKALKAKVVNLGKLFSWVVANGGADLTVFKPLDFTSLAAKTTYLFLDSFFTHLILACYTTSPQFLVTPTIILGSTSKAQEKLALGAERLQGVFEKALSRADVAQGISYYLATRFTGKKAEVSDSTIKLVGGQEVMRLVVRGFGIAQDILVIASQ